MCPLPQDRDGSLRARATAESLLEEDTSERARVTHRVVQLEMSLLTRLRILIERAEDMREYEAMQAREREAEEAAFREEEAELVTRLRAIASRDQPHVLLVSSRRLSWRPCEWVCAHVRGISSCQCVCV